MAFRKPRIAFLTSTIILSLVFSLSKNADANPAAQYGNTATGSTVKATPDPTVTNLARRYREANDNLILQAFYLQNKVEKIEQAISQGNTSDAKKALGSFCMSTETVLDDCVKRHKDFQGLALVRIRSAIGTNEDHIARLTSGRKFDGSVEGDLVNLNLGQKQDPYTPDIPTVYDLEAEYKKSGTLSGMPGKKTQYGDLKKSAVTWVQQLSIQDPNAKEIKFKAPVAADPRDPARKDQKIVMHERGYQGEDLNDPEVKKYLQDKAIAIQKGFSKDDYSPAGTQKADAFDAKKIQTDDKLNYEAFKEARETLISAVEKTYKEGAEVAQVKSAQSNATQASLKQKTTQYKDTDKIRRPASNTKSNYIRYDLSSFWETIKRDYK